MVEAHVSRVCVPFDVFVEYFASHMHNPTMIQIFTPFTFSMTNDDVRRGHSVAERFINIDYLDDEYTSNIWWRPIRSQDDAHLTHHNQWVNRIDYSEAFAEMEEHWHYYPGEYTYFRAEDDDEEEEEDDDEEEEEWVPAQTPVIIDVQPEVDQLWWLG